MEEETKENLLLFLTIITIISFWLTIYFQLTENIELFLVAFLIMFSGIIILALYVLTLDKWKHIKCSKCKEPVAISCTGYVHCVHCGTGNDPPCWEVI